MTELQDWLNARPFVGPAKYYRTQRRIGGKDGPPGEVPRLIVIHTMEAPEDANRALSTALWVRDSGGGDARQVSTHFTVDDQAAIRCVLDEHVAFTEGAPWNDFGLSIEQAGYAAQDAGDWQDAYSVAQRRLVARIVAAWCEKHGIPPVFVDVGTLAAEWRTVRGVTTHAAIARASQTPALKAIYTPGNHTDPGPNYPMDMLLAEVRALLVSSKPIEPIPQPQPPVTPVPNNGDDDDVILIMHDDQSNYFRVADTVRNVGAGELAQLRALIPTGKVVEVPDAAGENESYNLRSASRLTGSTLTP